MKPPADLADAFRARGLKVTPQRQLLFRLLEGNQEHPTAEALYAQASAEMPGISLRTVYTTLSDLADMGELAPLCVDGGATRFDPNVDDHHHVVCSACGSIGDVYVDGTEHLVVHAPSSEGSAFRATSTSIVFHGTCADCAAVTIP